MKNFIKILLSFTVLLVSAIHTIAQQTILNVPSSDILEKGKVYIQLDSTFKPNNQEELRKFSSFVPRIVAGTGHDVEVGLNVLGNIQPGSDTTTIVPTVKWRIYNGETNGIQLVVGNNLFVPVRNRNYKLGNYAYAQISKTFKNKTRLTVGGYNFSKNVVAPNASRSGGQFGLEHPINSKFWILVDYYTGKHSAGYFTPGINFKINSRMIGYLGYSIGNAEAKKGNHFFYASVGINLN